MILANISLVCIISIIYILIVELVIYLSDMYTRNQVKVRRANNIMMVMVFIYIIYSIIDIK